VGHDKSYCFSPKVNASGTQLTALTLAISLELFLDTKSKYTKKGLIPAVIIISPINVCGILALSYVIIIVFFSTSVVELLCVPSTVTCLTGCQLYQ